MKILNIFDLDMPLNPALFHKHEFKSLDTGAVSCKIATYTKGKRKMKMIILVFITFWGFWLVNLAQTIECDFKAPYRCEIIGALGFIIPPASIVTVFADRSEK